jgi:hypothetical protein
MENLRPATFSTTSEMNFITTKLNELENEVKDRLNEIKKATVETFVDEKNYHMPDNKYLVHLSLYNPSRITVENINIDADTDGLYQIIRKDKDNEEGYFKHNIQIGELRQLNNVEIYLWLRYRILTNNIKVNFKDDYIKLQEPVIVTGFYSWLAKYSLLENFFFRLLPLIYIVYYLIKLIEYVN